MKQKDILLLMVPTFFVLISWVGFSIYRSTVTSTISEPLTTQIQPISPEFDLETINKLKARQRVTPLFELEATTQSADTIPEEEESELSDEEATESAEEEENE